MSRTVRQRQGGRGGPTFAGYPLAGWWERALARGVDFVILWVILLVISIVVAIITFVAGRPLLGERTAGRVMQVSVPVLAFLVAVGYDTRIVDPRTAEDAEGDTIGKMVVGWWTGDSASRWPTVSRRPWS